MLFEGSDQYTDDIINRIIKGTTIRLNRFKEGKQKLMNPREAARIIRNNRGRTLEQLKEHVSIMLQNCEDSVAYLETLKKSNKDD